MRGALALKRRLQRQPLGEQVSMGRGLSGARRRERERRRSRKREGARFVSAIGDQAARLFAPGAKSRERERKKERERAKTAEALRAEGVAEEPPPSRAQLAAATAKAGSRARMTQ